MPDVGEEDDGPSQEWLASYADAMTLLLAFFIMMFAFALIDEEKFSDFKVGVAAAFALSDPVTDGTDSILSSGSGVAPELGPVPLPVDDESSQEAETLKSNLQQAGTVTVENALELKTVLEFEFDRLGAGELVAVGIDERGVFIRFDGQVLFPPNEVTISDDGFILLGTAAEVLGSIDNQLEIEGHTDNRPAGAPWPTNWELSSARASRVVRWLIEVGDLPDPQMIAVGRSDTRPRDDNSSPEGRAQNRRVEIVVRITPGDNEALEAIATDVDTTVGDTVDDSINLDETFDTGLPGPAPNNPTGSDSSP